jgi:hypothetical protein
VEDLAAPSVQSILLGSPEPERLARWYADALATGQRGDGRLDLGAVSVIFGRRPQLSARNSEPDRLVLNVSIDDISAVEKRLIDMRVVWAREVEWTPYGRIGTVLDPDGNYVQVMEAKGIRR